MFRVCVRCSHVRRSGWCGSCHHATEPFVRRGGDAVDLHACSLCGDPAEAGEDWCTSCRIDVELEIDEVLDAPTPGID